MKKVSIALLLLTGGVLSCNNENLKVSQSENNKGEYTFNISVSSIQGDTKAVNTGWEENDIISLWFDGATSDPTLLMKRLWIYHRISQSSIYPMFTHIPFLPTQREHLKPAEKKKGNERFALIME